MDFWDITKLATTNIAHIHFITQDGLSLSHADQARVACQAGLRWVQFRSKSEDAQLRRKLALQVKGVCEQYQATLIVNDFVELALEIGAHGVHLGLMDPKPQEARQILGSQAIIGATINSELERVRAQDRAVDYVGIGPYRFTTTKKNLSNVLGIYGIRNLLRSIREVRPYLPVIAIGGIALGDMAEIMACGVNGVAVSSAISAAPDSARAAKEFAEFFLYREMYG